jgi:hypothetical protein
MEHWAKIRIQGLDLRMQKEPIPAGFWAKANESNLISNYPLWVAFVYANGKWRNASNKWSDYGNHSAKSPAADI